MHSEGLVVGVKPGAAPSWVANFVRGLTNYDLVIAHPNAHDALIVAGGQGYVIDPLTAKLLSTFGGAIVDAFPHPTQRAIVVNHQNLRLKPLVPTVNFGWHVGFPGIACDRFNAVGQY
jgi:hypothetical protein